MTAIQVTIYLNESDKWDQILQMLKRENVAAGSVFHAVAGFNGRNQVHTASLVEAGGNLPVILIFVVSSNRIADAEGVGRKDVYSKVTDRIISDLEQGIRPWMKPWNAEHAAGRITKPLRHNGTPYRGMNILLLRGEAMTKGYAAPIWMTYKQAQELGGNVRKGEHGTLVVYANTLSKTEMNEQGEDVEREIPFMKGYTVFNVEQVDGLPAHYQAEPENPLPLSERIAHADQFITATGASIQHDGNSAFYAPSRDTIQLPPFEAFKDKESYYATGLHELTHWTKAKHRLDRDFSAKRFGDSCYAREELVAELGAAFLCAELGITPECGRIMPTIWGTG
jgi:antirestriction protein ArdC